MNNTITLIIVLVIVLTILGAILNSNQSNKISCSSMRDDPDDDDPFTSINYSGMPGNIWSDTTDDLHSRHLRDD